jgi:hypothetical protein
MFRQDLNQNLSEESSLIAAVIRLLPYLLLAGIVHQTAASDKTVMWMAAGVIVGFQIFVSIVAIMADEVKWRIAGMRNLREACLSFLRSHDFPNPSKIFHWGFIDYLKKVEDPATDSSESVRSAAKKEVEDWELLVLHLSEKQRKRYMAVMDEALTNWFALRWLPQPIGNRA